MKPLLPLTVANIRSFVRDRASLFWTIAFPVMFILLFGAIFSGSGTPSYQVGWVDLDRTEASTTLRQRFGQSGLLQLTDGTEGELLEGMRSGDLRAVVVVPPGFGEAVARSQAGQPVVPVSVKVYTDPSQQNVSTALQQLAAQVVSGMNLALAGRSPVVVLDAQPLQTERLTAAAYFVPSILAMALMQLGVFGAIPLAAQREKLIFKRLAATPLRRWSLVGGTVLMRLLIAAFQTVVIVAIGTLVFDVRILGNPLLVAFIVALGALTFIALGFVIGSFARTEEAANAICSVTQFPLMFLSGIFFPIDFMPDVLQPIAAVLPLTYLGDALRQVMVGGSPYVPLALGLAILAGWLVACMGIAARFFRWE